MTTEAASTSAPSTRKKSARRVPPLRELLLHAVVQDRVLKRAYPGIMHFMIFWGMTIQILGTVINILQYPLFVPIELAFPRGAAYLGFELVMDIGGGMILVGVLMAFARRAFFKPEYLPNRWDDWYALALLFVVAVIGFFSEAVRIMAADPEWRAWSPIGNLLANGLSGQGVDVTVQAPIHATLFWAHAAVGTLFFVSLPFTKLRHLVTGPMNIALRPRRKAGELETITDLESAETLGAGEIGEYPSTSLLSFDACAQCGRCEDVCPSHAVGMAYSPRALIYNLHRSMHDTLMGENGSHEKPLLGGYISTASPWLCTTCGACLEICPVFLDPVSAVIELRRHLTLMTGDIPGSVGETLMQMERRGNPWGLPKEEHATWAKELGVRVLQPGEQVDTLLYLGCAYGYDSRNQKAGRALVNLLQSAGVDFAILGSAEGCCGETARRMGHEYVFQVMVEENLETFNSVSFSRMVTPCAHCFNTLKNEYPAFGADFEVIHHSELISELMQSGQIETDGGANGKRFTYHDSCYLGRYNQIYDQPRKALDGVPDLKRAEMAKNKSDGFCCGGGGGHMWLETDPNTRINNARLEQAVETEADIVVTACPYCLIMFEDAIGSTGRSDQIQAKDLAEVLDELG
ncbi:MAG: heterodisulfide reductase-related iron-sulfur binding cluster [Anaerolineales bacterium]|nr:heterodisulfide reductase-related iron-sulfur binding cluster [Anaerolineales bacterium]